MKPTRQEEIWSSKFGLEYNLRNVYDNKGLDDVYISDIGISRTEMNRRFLGEMDREIKILEVGCNIGLQMVNLQEMGFKNLYGIELQWHAIEFAKGRTKELNIVHGTAYDIPFKTGFFDLVFTNRVLIHLNPDYLTEALKEIVRCSSCFVYGSEYYADKLTEIKRYEGYENVLWKRDFAKCYMELFLELKLVKEEKYKYTFNDDLDSTFLLKK